MVSSVPGQEEIGGQAAFCTAPGVHRGGLQDGRRSLHEPVGEVGGPPGRLRVIQRLGLGRAVLERGQRHPHGPLPAIGGVGVRDVGGQRSVGGPYDQRAAVLDRGPELEGGSREAQASVDFAGQGFGVLTGQVATHPPVDDLPILLCGEVHPVGQLAVPELHPRADGLQHAAAGVFLPRVVPEDGEDGDVGLRGDVRGHRVHDSLGPFTGQAVEDRHPGGLQGRPPAELRDRVVGEAVQADVQELVHGVIGTSR